MTSSGETMIPARWEWVGRPADPRKLVHPIPDSIRDAIAATDERLLRHENLAARYAEREQAVTATAARLEQERAADERRLAVGGSRSDARCLLRPW